MTILSLAIGFATFLHFYAAEDTGRPISPDPQILFYNYVRVYSDARETSQSIVAKLNNRGVHRVITIRQRDGRIATYVHQSEMTEDLAIVK